MTRIFTRAALCICCACGLWGCPRQHAASAAAGSAPQHPQDFKLPHIPAALTTPEARADYLAAHYWDNFDFRDTTLISRPEITEQAFADFIDLLTAAPISAADSALVRMMEASTADSAMFAHFTELSENTSTTRIPPCATRNSISPYCNTSRIRRTWIHSANSAPATSWNWHSRTVPAISRQTFTIPPNRENEAG